MSHLKQILLIFSLISISSHCYSQTEIGGIINSDITLTLDESPYKITSNLVIAPDGVITIEPGVELRFLQDTKLEVRGILLSIGTSDQKIKFTSDSGVTKGSWIGLDIKNTQAQDVSLMHCDFSNASSAISEECCWGGSVSIENCSFVNNSFALSGYSGDVTQVKSCYFSDNTYCVVSADKRIEDCTFENNVYGLFNTERVSVYNSTFTGHSEVAVFGGRGDLKNSIVENNNIGVQNFFEGFTVDGTIISNNTIGIQFNNTTDNFAPISNSEICNNSNLNLNNMSSLNIDLYSNCLCLEDQDLIEKTIFDGDDDNSIGFISYDIFDENCVEVVSTVDKTLPASNIWTLANSPYILTENFIVTTNDTLFIEPGVEVRFDPQVNLEVRGTLMSLGEEQAPIKFTSNGLGTAVNWAGLRIMHSQSANAYLDYCVFEFAEIAIFEECCWGGMVSIQNTQFLNNNIAIGGYSGDATLVKNCYFSDNNNCLTGADKRVEDCTFENNDYGLYSTERTSVYNSSFTGHSGAALYGGGGDLVNSTIENNNIGVQTSREGFTIDNSIISNNNIGIEFENYNQDYAAITNSQICNNEEFNARNKSDTNINLYTNCWCSGDQILLEEKLFDGDDDNEIGLISYDIYDDLCEELISKVDKTSPDIFYWTLPNSPYTITEDYVLFPNKTLVIEPGVIVEVAQNINFEIRGTLLIQGNEQDSVYFLPISGDTTGSWPGINILNTLGGNADIQYGVFKYANIAIQEECCWGGNVAIRHSSFVENEFALSGYSGDVTTVDSSYFAYNTYAITNADKIFDFCLFENNVYGLFKTERIDVFNSQFFNHTESALYGGRGVVDGCDIVNNNIGIKGFFEGFTILNSVINENNMGIELSEANDFIATVEYNDICHNLDYNVYNTSDNNASLITNCWCDADSTRVEDLLHDGWDNSEAGLMDYTLFTNDCKDKIFQTDKENNEIIYFGLTSTYQTDYLETLVSVYPNPVADFFTIDYDGEIEGVSLVDLRGISIAEFPANAQTDKMYLETKLSGLYFLKIRLENNQIVTKKITFSN